MATGKHSESKEPTADAAASTTEAAPAVSPNPTRAQDDDSGGGGDDESLETLEAEQRHHLLYKGAGGQMAVMSEFLYRMINVAVPEVWTDFIVIRRSVLRQLQADQDVGTVSKNDAGEPIALKLR